MACKTQTCTESCRMLLQSFSVRTITDFIPDISLHTLPAAWLRTVHDTECILVSAARKGNSQSSLDQSMCTTSREMHAPDFLGSRLTESPRLSDSRQTAHLCFESSVVTRKHMRGCCPRQCVALSMPCIPDRTAKGREIRRHLVSFDIQSVSHRNSGGVEQHDTLLSS